MIQNYALVLAYDGTGFHGWQVQGTLPTIQKALTDAVFAATGELVYVSGCGRTDAGVHARVYVANFKGSLSIPADRLPFALNARLPRQIVVKQAFLVPEDFDARFSCIKKEYTYEILPAVLSDPFLLTRAYHHKGNLDVAAMDKGAKYFLGKQDFAAVKSVGTPVRSTVRTMYEARVYEESGLVKIAVCADGFLYNMVRAIAGTLLAVGSGRIQPEAVDEILKSCDRQNAGATLPPQGLYMSRLWYSDFHL